MSLTVTSQFLHEAHGHGFQFSTGSPSIVSRSQHFQVLQQLEAARRRIYDLEIANAQLAATATATESAFAVLAKAQPAMLQASQAAATSNPFAPNLDPLASNNSLDYGARTPGPRGPQHSKIRMWTTKDYKPFGKRGNQRHHGQSSDGVDIYLERLDGTIISYKEYTDLRNVLKRHVNTLIQHGHAASTWSALNNEAHAYICRGLKKSFEGFDYCDDGKWKVNLFGMLVYPDAMREREAGESKSKKRASSVIDITDEGDAQPRKKKPKSVKKTTQDVTQGLQGSELHPEAASSSGAGAVASSNSTQASSAASAVIPTQSTSMNPTMASQTTSDPLDPSLQSPAPQATNTGTPTSATVIPTSPPESANATASTSRDANVTASPVSASATRAMVATNANTHITAPSPTPNASETTSSSPSVLVLSPADNPREPASTTLAPQNRDAGTAHPEDAALLAMDDKDDDDDDEEDYTANPLAKFINRDASPPPNLVETIKISGVGTGSGKEGAPAKKAAKMRPTDKRTARNMYAVVYMRDHPDATTRDFDTAWRGSEGSDRIQKLYKAMADFASTRETGESLESIITAFKAMNETERKKYTNKPKAKGKARKKKGEEAAAE
ncbi:hypothetical protein C8T65DRAFT_735953 [Cerioporus squamosus]|nr:hypothetical protein C8T65DRAFT_735953 [Cerioporus squamosus]